MARYSRGRPERGKTPFRASGALGKTRERMRILRESQIKGVRVSGLDSVLVRQTMNKISNRKKR